MYKKLISYLSIYVYIISFISGLWILNPAETVPASHFPELDAMYQKALDAVSRNSLPERVAIAFQIGRRLSRWSGSHLAHDMLNRVGSLALWQHRFLDFDVPAASQRQVELHGALVEAVKTRNAVLAEATAREIVALTRTFLVPRVRLQENAPAVKRGKK